MTIAFEPEEETSPAIDFEPEAPSASVSFEPAAAPAEAPAEADIPAATLEADSHLYNASGQPLFREDTPHYRPPITGQKNLSALRKIKHQRTLQLASEGHEGAMLSVWADQAIRNAAIESVRGAVAPFDALAPTMPAPPVYTGPPEGTIGPAPTLAGELMAGNIGNAGSMAYELARRPFSGLIGPTERQRSEEMVPFGVNPDGTVKYEYRPLGNRLEREAGLFTPIVEPPHFQPNAEDSGLTATGKGVANVAAGLAGTFMSPLGAVLPGAAKLPTASRVASGLFAADMLAQVPGQVSQIADAPTIQGKVEGGLGAVVGLGLGGLAAKHALTRPAAAAPPVPPEIAPAVEAAGLPETAKAIREEAAKPPEPPKADESTEPKQDAPGIEFEPSSVPEEEASGNVPPESKETGAPAQGSVPAVDAVPEIHRPAFDLLEALRNPIAERVEIKTEAPEAPTRAAETPAAEPETETEVSGLRTEEVPVDQLTLSSDVPQFKGGANAAGVVEPLEGKFDRTGVGPIQIWRRTNGQLEIISGRHRFDLAKRSGEKTIPGQIHNEADGFDVRAAARLDAELNIRDGQGTAADYANYFRNSDVTEADASARGLLARAKGRAGFAVARNASEDVFALHQSGKLSDAAAEAVTNAAPGNADAQRIGLRALNAGAGIADAANAIRAALAASKGEKATQGDFFSDTGLDEQWLKQGKIATQAQKTLREQIASVQGAAKKPEVARKLGVDVQDPEGVQKRVAELKADLARWENWPSHPDLVKITMGEGEPATTVDFTDNSASVRVYRDGESLGLLTGKISDGELRLETATLAKDLRGEGRGVEMYRRMIAEAESRGLKVASDAIVTKDAQRVYESLRKAGVKVTQNPEAVKNSEGTMTTKDGSPVFRIGEEPEAAPYSYVQPQRVLDRPAGEREEVVTIDIAAFDKAWTKDKGYYVEKGGEQKPGARRNFEDWLKKNPGKPIETPEISVAEDGTPSFTNGRHRYAVLRDKGETTMQVSMSPADAARARKAGLVPKPKADLFAGKADDPFNLTAESPAEMKARLAREDAERVAKEKKEAEEAKAASDKLQGDLFGSATPKTPEHELVERIREAAEKAPTEADLDAQGKTPGTLEFPRPNGAGKIVVLNTKESLVKLADRFAPKSDATHLQAVADAVEPLKQKVSGVRVRVLRSEADLPENVRSRLNPRSVHEGLADTERGDVYIFADNIGSPARAAEVFAHEVVGHFGVERLIGDAEFGKIADTIYRESLGAARQIETRYGKAGQPADRLTVAREYVARLAEKPALAPKAWEQIVSAFRRAMRGLGIVREWTEGDIRDLLRRAGKAVEDKGERRAGGDVRAAVRDLGKEVEEHSPYASDIEDALQKALPDKAERDAVDAYVTARLAGKDAPDLAGTARGIAERLLTYFRNKQEFADRNGVADAVQKGYDDRLAANPNLDLAERLAVFDSEVNKAVAIKTSTPATPGPAPADSKSPTSIKNAVVDEERAKRGLPPAMEPARRDFGSVWDDAMRQIDADHDVARNLVDELDSRPRALTDTEDALLLHRQITLQNEFDSAARAAVEASDAGDLAAAEEQRLRTAFASDELQRLYDVGKKVGTETGRGLNARKMMATENYSLASMTTKKRAANGGRPLTAEQAAEVQAAADDIAKAEQAVTEAEAKADTAAATEAAEQAVKEVVKAARPSRAKPAKAPSEAPPTAKSTAGWIEKQAEAARQRIRDRGGRLNVGIDPFELADRVIIAAADIAGGLRDFATWAQKQLQTWGAEFQPHLQEVWDRANAMLNQHASVAGIAEKMRARVEEGASLAQLRPYVQKVATALVKSGISDLERLLDAMHPILEEVVPGTSRRQAMDLFSGYGEFRPLDKDAVKVTLRDLRGQAQQIGKLQDMKAGEAPKKTGPERRTPSDKERALIKEVEDAKKRGGFRVTDPETQLRTAMQAVKARLRNQIVDMTTRLETGERPPERAGLQYDQEAEILRALRDRVRDTLNALEDKPAMTEEQRVRNAADAIKRSIDEYNRRLEEEDFAPKQRKPAVVSPELDALRAQRDALKAEYEEFRELDEQTARARAEKRESDLEKQIARLDERLRTGDVSTKPPRAGEPSQRAEDLTLERDAMRQQLDAMRREANRPVLTAAEKEALVQRRALAAFKKRTATRIAELTAKLAAGDFAPRPPRMALKLDPAALKAKADLQRIKDDYERGLIKDRLSKRNTFERAMDGAAKWRRAFVLSGVHTIFKLASAATEIIGIAPIEEAIGGAIGKLPGARAAAERAPRHGGFNVKAEAEAIASNFTKLFKDFSDYSRTGGTDLDAVFGESHLYPFEWKELIGRMHGALKTPARRNEFTRAYRKRLEFAGRQGADITDPMTQTKIGLDAYKDSMKSIFMEDNMVVDAYKRGLSRFTQVDKTTGGTTVAGKTAETLLKISLPVIRIPTNIVARTFEYTLGTVSGSFRLARAFRAGIDNLHPDEADLILQNLKRGSLGAAVLLIGYLNPESVGGYYQGKRKEDDVKEGGLRIYGHDIPKLLVHNPLLEQLQIGATVRRVSDSKLRKRDRETQGIGHGVVAAGLGLVEEVPFADLVSRAGKAMQNGEELGHYLADQLRSIVIPQIVEEIAKVTDKDDDTGEPTKRKAQTAADRIKLGVPGLRATVPEAKKKR